MGTLGDVIKGAWANSYNAVLKFRADMGKGMVVGESGIPIRAIRVRGAPRGIDIRSTDDQAIRLQVLHARKFKNVSLILDMDSAAVLPAVQKAVRELNDLYSLKQAFHASIGITNRKDGQITEAYVLSDRSASLSAPPIPTEDSIAGSFPIFLDLKSPELMHGVGDIYKHGLQKV